MRLGIDATSLGQEPCGIRNYTAGLLDALVELEPRWRYRLAFVGPREARTRLGAYARPPFTTRALVLPEPLRRLGDKARFLLQGALAGPVDWFWAPNFHLPLFTMARRRCVTVHDLSIVEHPEWFTGTASRYTRRLMWSLRRADAILADSQFTRDRIMRVLGLPAERVHVVYCGTDPRFQAPAAPSSLDQIAARYALDFPYILSVGTVQPRKNYARLIDAFNRLALPDVHLVIVGAWGWLYDDVRKAVADSPVHDRIHVLTDVEDDLLPALYARAHAFCLPSLYEGFGIPLLEAMASGLPVATSSASSLPEVTGDVAVYFEPTDIEGMTEALRRVCVESALRADLSARGRARAAEFTWSRFATRFRDILYEASPRTRSRQ